VLTLPADMRIYIACGVTDMRRGFDGLAAQVQTVLNLNPFGGALFLFRGRRGDLIKGLVWDGQGLVLYAKRLEKGRFTWPQAREGKVSLTPAQMAMLLEGIDWRMPAWTARPQAAV
jgi:transposase